MDIKNEEEVKLTFHLKAIHELEAHSLIKFSQNWIRIPSFEN